MDKMTGTLYTYNGGWSSGAIGSKAGYVSVADSTAVRTYLKFTTKSPSAGYKISQIKVQIGLVFDGGGKTTLSGYLYTSEPKQLTNAPAGYIASATSSEVTLSASGTTATLTFTIPDSYRWTSAQTLYIWLCTSKRGMIQVWAKDNSSGSDWLVPRYELTQVAAGVVRIYTSSGWKMAIPYVYTSSGWKQAIPYVYTSSGWKNTC